MESFREIFLSEVEAFLSATGMDKTTLGMEVLKDSMFVTDLRAGREPREKTVRKVRQFMADYTAERERELEKLKGIVAGEAA